MATSAGAGGFGCAADEFDAGLISHGKRRRHDNDENVFFCGSDYYVVAMKKYTSG